jgi:UDP-N-acetylglucosamine acyltransferase
MAVKIHKQAIVSPEAKLADGVSIGPFSIVEGAVEIGAGTEVRSHVVIRNNTRIGKNNVLCQFANVGEDPADLKYGGEQTYLEMGDNNIVREGCALHRGTKQGGGVTRIGSNNYFMSYAHVAHDAYVKNNTILGYVAVLAGHTVMGDHANISGGAKVIPHCRIGAYSFVTVDTTIRHDVPAFIIMDGIPRGINRIGMERRNISDERIKILEQAYKLLYLKGLRMDEAVKQIKALGPSEDIDMFIDSFTKHEGRGIVRPREHKRDQS